MTATVTAAAEAAARADGDAASWRRVEEQAFIILAKSSDGIMTHVAIHAEIPDAGQIDPKNQKMQK